MQELKSFDFEGTRLRVFGDMINPLFVAADICAALGITNPSMAISKLANFEKTLIDIGQGPAINAVNESGLYTLILRSRDAVKEGTPAYRFRLKVTAEILPAIRRTGRYETAQSALITTTEQYEIRKAIKSRAKNSSVHYQTVYNALYDYFKIASYKDLRHDQMKAALTLIETCTLKPQLPAPTLAEGSVILSAQEAEALLTFIYYVRFLFADVFGKLDGLLRIVDSPLAGSFWDAFHEVSWGRILEILAKHGHDINDMPCYQHWSSCQPKRKAA